MSGRTLVATAIAAAAALSGCFTTAADYRAEAEAFIVDDVTIPDEDVSFTDATCEEPENQDPGTQFGCTAIDGSGATWTFGVTIEEDDRFVVSVTDRP